MSITPDGFVWMLCAFNGGSSDLNAKHQGAGVAPLGRGDAPIRVSLFGGVAESVRYVPAATSQSPTAGPSAAPTTSTPTMPEETLAPTAGPATTNPSVLPTASPTASPTVIHTVSWGLSRVGQASITIETGNTVRWVLDQQGGHNVVSGPAHGSSDGRFQSPWLSSLNDAWSYRFTVAGSFPYYCSPHQNMVANITVVDDLSAITSAPATSAPTLLPSSLPSTASPTTSSPTTPSPTTSTPTTSTPHSELSQPGFAR